jgi:hypothetical protein
MKRTSTYNKSFLLIIAAELSISIFLFIKIDSIIATLMFLTLLSFDLFFLKRFEAWQKKYQDGIIFFTTILTTFLGVYLALLFSNYQSEKNDKAKTVQFLIAAQSDLLQSRLNMGIAVEYAEKEYGNMTDLIFHDTLVKLRKMNAIQVFQKPKMLDLLIQNEVTLNSLPPRTVEALLTINSVFSDLYRKINELELGTAYWYIKALKKVVSFHDYVLQLLEYTKQLMRNEMSLEEWSDLRNKNEQREYINNEEFMKRQDFSNSLHYYNPMQ